MILYISNATDYSIYNRLFNEKKITTGYQMQKFNSIIISGLSLYEKMIALSILPYDNVNADRVEAVINKVRYIGIKNIVGKLHVIWNPILLLIEGIKIIKKEKPRYIICDAISKSPCYISKLLGKLLNIPVVGIITDFPGTYLVNTENESSIKRMKGFDAYILLTEQMNGIINPDMKPYMIMEGLCSSDVPDLTEKHTNKVVMYAGSLWEHDAGIEYLVNGFIKANYDDLELRLYGSGALVPWLVEVSKHNKNIKYMGCVTNDEVVSEQCKASLLVNPRPSTEEFCKYSFPSKTIEYMLSGTPVLMTKLPGVPREYFEYVFSIEDETEEGIIKALNLVFSKSSEELELFGKTAREFVLKEKSCVKQCERIISFLRSLN